MLRALPPYDGESCSPTTSSSPPPRPPPASSPPPQPPLPPSCRPPPSPPRPSASITGFASIWPSRRPPSSRCPRAPSPPCLRLVEGDGGGDAAAPPCPAPPDVETGVAWSAAAQLGAGGRREGRGASRQREEQRAAHLHEDRRQLRRIPADATAVSTRRPQQLRRVHGRPPPRPARQLDRWSFGAASWSRARPGPLEPSGPGPQHQPLRACMACILGDRGCCRRGGKPALRRCAAGPVQGSTVRRHTGIGFGTEPRTIMLNGRAAARGRVAGAAARGPLAHRRRALEQLWSHDPFGIPRASAPARGASLAVEAAGRQDHGGRAASTASCRRCRRRARWRRAARGRRRRRTRSS